MTSAWSNHILHIVISRSVLYTPVSNHGLLLGCRSYVYGSKKDFRNLLFLVKYILFKRSQTEDCELMTFKKVITAVTVGRLWQVIPTSKYVGNTYDSVVIFISF